MASASELAVLSLYVYRSTGRNTPQTEGWETLIDRTEGTFGFAYGVFRNLTSNEVVIAYRGTDGSLGDWLTNLGLIEFQEMQAAKVYAKALSAYGIGAEGSNISFTGHSLGGGIAATMGVLFDRPATAFDPAPTQRLAQNLLDVLLISSSLGKDAPKSITDYVKDIQTQFSRREGNVSSYFSLGSQLHALSTDATTIAGQGQEFPVQFGVENMTSVASRIDMHSQALLTAGLLAQDVFPSATVAVQRALPLVFDKDLYDLPAEGIPRNFLLDLIRSELDRSGSSKLRHFAADLNRLGLNVSGLSATAQDAIIAQAIEWYYWNADYTGQEFFGEPGSLLQYTTAKGEGFLGALDKASKYVRPWLQLTAAEYGAGRSISADAGRAYDQWNVSAGSGGVSGSAKTATKSQIFVGNGGADAFTGGARSDLIFAGAGSDTVDGGGGNDKLYGGAGTDTYNLSGAFGKDTVIDSDGQGVIRLADLGVTLSGGRGNGTRNQWVGRGGEIYTFLPTDGPQIGTLTVGNVGAGNEVRIERFDLGLASGGQGYLGIELDNTPEVALVQGSAGNFWSSYDATLSSLEGRTASVSEGAGTTFTISLNRPATFGSTIKLAVSGLAGTLKAILGDETVDADGAQITLAEGQTKVTFAFVQEGDLAEDALGSVAVTYQGDTGTATSNSWNLSLRDTGESGVTLNGDMIAVTEPLTGLLPINRDAYDGTPVEVVKVRGLHFIGDGHGNLGQGTDQPKRIPVYLDGDEIIDYVEVPSDDIMVTDNVFFGTSGNDKINGLTGNDLLGGEAGNDQIDGGTGDDMIGGGAGNDRINGGDGNDYISGSANVLGDRQQYGPEDTWDRWGPPAGTTADVMGATWGVYPDSGENAFPVWDGLGLELAEDQSDFIDGGAGDDWVLASAGDDRALGGDGADHVEGLAGNDIVEGGDGDDTLVGDGTVKGGYRDSVAADRHGSDFIDGGSGDDDIDGGGGSDNIFGGAGKDSIYADGSGTSDSDTFIDFAYQGEDYIDGEDGDDYVEGGGRDDVIYGGAGKDTLWGDTSAANLSGAAATNPAAWGNDYLDGEDDDDLLYGGGGDDTLYGGKGKDQLLGDDGAGLDVSMHGSDYLDGEDGDDTLVGGGKDDLLFGGDGDDTLLGDALDLAGEFHGDDYLDGEDGDDVLFGLGGSDQLFGGKGNDELQGDDASVAAQYQGADLVDGGEGDDRLFGGGGDDTLLGGAGADEMSGDDGDDLLDGEADADVLVGGAGADTLLGGEGADSLYGGAGDDRLEGGAGDDDLNSGDGDDVLDGGAGDDLYGIYGTQGTKILIDEGGSETLDLGWLVNETELGRGSLLLRNKATGQEVHVEGFDASDATSVSPIEQFVLSDMDGMPVVLSAQQLIEQLGFAAHGTDGNDLLEGTAFNDVMEGGAGDDVLFGNQGNDRLAGGGGSDQLLGGRGDDVYVADGQGDDEIFEAEDEGRDTVEASVDYTLTAANVEVVQLTGTQAIAATGNDGANRLVGNGAANVLDGGAGADRLEGRGGDDTYVVDSTEDVVVELANEGTDQVIASVSYVLPVDVENLVLAAGAESGTGNEGDNRIEGNQGDNRLRGFAGNDQLEGGNGSDVYVVRDDPGVKTIRDSGGESDLLDLGWNELHLHFIPGSGGDGLGLYNPFTGQSVEIEDFDVLAEHAVSSVERVRLTLHLYGAAVEQDFSMTELFRNLGLSFFGTSEDDTVTGSWRPDRLFGFDGNDTLLGLGGNDTFDGGGGLDRMVGGAGDDTFLIYDSGDEVVELAGEGFDTVKAEVDFSIDGTDVEAMRMMGPDRLAGTGNALRNYMYASLAGSSLYGEGGNDELIGYQGDDRLYGGAQDDFLVAGGGADLLAGDEGNDELVAGEGDDALEGGDGDDRMHGDSGANQLDGGAGDDMLWAGEGDDVLQGGAGNDVLRGEDGQDQLFGGDGDDVLFNSVGGDLLAGGSGDDVYQEDAASGILAGFAASETQIVEEADAGIDTVIAYEAFTLGANLENLVLRQRPEQDRLVGIGNELANRLESTGEGTGADLFGLEGDDVLVGGTGMNWLDGGLGADLMIGGTGQTEYFVDDAGDSVVALAAGTDDTVHSSIDYALGDFVENLVLEDGAATTGTGNELANRITGNANDNFLDGGAGSDLISGGAGNDILDGTQGQDGLSGDDGDDLLLGSDEGTTMLGGAGFDRLLGGASNDVLDGGTEADIMVGAGGDDTYVVDDADDQVLEEADAGTDTVVAFVDYALQDVLENLFVRGWGLTGVGNGLDNVITGREGGETLMGLDGNDVLDAGGGWGAVLDGGAGDDTLIGGAGGAMLLGGEGDDFYRLTSTDDSVVEQAAAGYDRVVLELGPETSGYFNLGDNVEALDASLSGGGLQIEAHGDDNLIAGGAGSDQIDGGGGNDTIRGGQAVSAFMDGWWSESAFDDIQSFLRHGPTVPRTLDRLIADYSGGIRLDAAAADEGYFAYRAFQVSATPGDSPQPMTLYVAPWLADDPQDSQALFIQPDGSLTWDGGGSFQQELDQWSPRSRVTWEELESRYGVRATVAAGEGDAYLTLTGYGIPAPGQAADDPEGWYRSATLYWPRDRLPAEIQGLLNDQPPMLDATEALAQAGADSLSGGDGDDVLDGEDGNDVLDGEDGNDMLFGGDGHDVLYGGADKTLTLRVGRAVEGPPVILDVAAITSSNDDVLDGGVGLDLMVGGSGNDTYYVDGESVPNPDARIASFDACDIDHRFGMDGTAADTWVADTVVEVQDEGDDTVIASASVVLSNVETVELSETGPILDIDASTGAGGQTLLGNSGRNQLDGGTGADVMAGGAGDDTYIVDDVGDMVVEAADAGQDIVRTGLDQYVLGDNVEALVLEGEQDLSGAGNAGANILVGNVGNNVLEGGDGDDLMAGWRGDDLLRGGAGFDVYVFSRGDGDDAVEDNFGGALHFSGDIRLEELGFRSDAGNLLINVGATGADDGVQVTLLDWLAGGDQRVSEITFCEGGFVPLDETVLMTPVADMVTISADAALVVGNVLDNDGDSALRDRLVVEEAYEWEGSFGTFRLGTDGAFDYTLAGSSDTVQSLAQGEIGTDWFDYGAVDIVTGRWLGYGDIRIDVVGVNDAPVAVADGGSVSEDGEVVLAGNVLANDSDVDNGDELSVTSTGAHLGRLGTLILSATGEFAYSLDNDVEAVQALAEGEQATESFDYVMVDSQGAEATASIEVLVSGANDAPTASADVVSCSEDGPGAVGNVLDNDSDVDRSDVLTIAEPGAVTGSYGILQLAADGSFSYTLDNSSSSVQALGAGERAVDRFAYTSSDNHGSTAQSTLDLEVVGVNDGPVAQADLASVAEDGVVTAAGNVLANDVDVDGDALAVTDAGSRIGQYGTLVLGASGAYSYNLANGSAAVQALGAGEKASDVFTYTVADTHGAAATAQLAVEVTGAADAAGVRLRGTDRNDKLVGTQYADVIDGGRGSDVMVGGAGDDVYFVDASAARCDDGDDDDDDDRDAGGERHQDDGHEDGGRERVAGDSVVELSSEGVDTVAASVNYVLPRNVENLMLLGTAPLAGSGNSQANVIVGSGGSSALSGAAGNDVLVGRSEADTLYGGVGDDKLYGEGGNDRLHGDDGADQVWGGAGKDLLEGGRGDNLLAGGAGDDIITAGTGSDVVVAGAGDDRVISGAGNDFIDGGTGNDVIEAGSGSDFIAAGQGNDVVTSGAGLDVIAFNRGDGKDTLVSAPGSGRSSGDVVSLGGGIRYADLTLRRTGQDLVLGLGAGDQITSANWYSQADSKSISALQIVTVGGDYSASSSNRLVDNKVLAFDFAKLTQQYDAARKADASLGAWGLQPALESAFLGASNTTALGGDLAFDYATTYAATQGYGTDMTTDAVRKEVQEQTGSGWQAADTAPTTPATPDVVDPWLALQAGTDLVVGKEPGASNPITPTTDPATDSLVIAALAASTDPKPSWAAR